MFLDAQINICLFWFWWKFFKNRKLEFIKFRKKSIKTKKTKIDLRIKKQILHLFFGYLNRFLLLFWSQNSPPPLLRCHIVHIKRFRFQNDNFEKCITSIFYSLRQFPPFKQHSGSSKCVSWLILIIGMTLTHFGLFILAILLHNPLRWWTR